MEEFYSGFAQRARDLAEKATRSLGGGFSSWPKGYELKSRPGSSYGRASAPPRAIPPTVLFSGSGEP